MTLKSQVLSGLKWSAAAKALAQAATWATTIVVMRLLEPSDYGIMAMAMLVVTLFGLFAELGLGSALVQAQKVSTEEARKLFGTAIIVNLILVSILVFSAPITSLFFNEPRLTIIIQIASLHFLVSVKGMLSESMLRRNMEFKKISIAEGVGAVAGAISSLAMAINGYGVWSLVSGLLAGETARVFVLLISTRPFLSPIFSLSGIGELATSGGLLTLNRFTWFAYSQSDIFIAGKFLSRDGIGVYAVSANLAAMPMQKALSVVNQIAFSAFSKLKTDQKALTASFRRSILVGGYLSIPILWGIASIAPEFVTVVLGEKWVDAIIPLQIICLVIPLRTISALESTVTSALGRPDIYLPNSLTGLFILPTCFFVGSHWGPNGLAAGWLVGLPLQVFFNIRRSQKVTGIGIRSIISCLWAPLLAGLIMGLSVYGIRLIISDTTSNLLRIFILIPTGALSFLASAIILDKAGLREIHSAITNKK